MRIGGLVSIRVGEGREREREREREISLLRRISNVG